MVSEIYERKVFTVFMPTGTETKHKFLFIATAVIVVLLAGVGYYAYRTVSASHKVSPSPQPSSAQAQSQLIEPFTAETEEAALISKSTLNFGNPTSTTNIDLSGVPVKIQSLVPPSATDTSSQSAIFQDGKQGFLVTYTVAGQDIFGLFRSVQENMGIKNGWKIIQTQRASAFAFLDATVSGMNVHVVLTVPDINTPNSVNVNIAVEQQQ